MKLKLIVISALVTLMLPSCAKNDTNQLYQEIKSVDKMVLAKMSITKTVINPQDNLLGRRIADTRAAPFALLKCLQSGENQASPTG